MSSTASLTFDDTISHRQIDAAAHDTIYVIGDVHGCRRPLRRLLDELDPGEDDLVVLVGDLVCKGPDSKGVLDLVRSHENVLSVRGNNEEKLLRGEKTLPALDEADLAWLAELPHVISWDQQLVVHGGLHPERSSSELDASSLLTMRSPEGNGYDGPFWFDTYSGPPRVYFGHTVVDTPIEREWAVGLDTGCVYGGSLTAYDTTRDRFVSVEPVEVHQERAAEKIVGAKGRSR